MSIDNSHTSCILAATRIIGDKWNPRILYALSIGANGFCAIQRELDGVNPRTLSNRLNALERDQIITKSHDESPHKTSYTLTEQGAALLPILTQMASWSATYHPTNNSSGV